MSEEFDFKPERELIVEHKGEKIFLAKSKYFGWRVIHPIKIDGKINWKNLIAGGNWFNLILIAFIVFVILSAASEYANAVNVANKCLEQINWIIPKA